LVCSPTEQPWPDGKKLWTDTGIVALVIFLALAAHLIEVGVWAVVFLLCCEFWKSERLTTTLWPISRNLGFHVPWVMETCYCPRSPLGRITTFRPSPVFRVLGGRLGEPFVRPIRVRTAHSLSFFCAQSVPAAASMSCQVANVMFC
jgi:hypothetical protein